MKYVHLKIIPIIIFIFNSIIAGQILKVPGTFATIQAAIDAANSGDTIIVAPGIYKENIAINKPVYLWSELGTDSTIIQDPEASSSWGTPETIVISINCNGYGEIKGFSIIGNFDVNGAGIYVGNDGWQIINCTFSKNHFGINTYNANANVTGCSFSNNNPLAIGAGHHSILINNRVIGNEDGIYAFDSTEVYNNLIANSYVAINTGDDYSSPLICNNLITSISSTGYSSQNMGIRFNTNSNKATVKNNIIAYCSEDGIFSSYGNIYIISSYHISNNDVYDNDPNYSELVHDRAGLEGNINTNPFFCDNENMFFLSSDSPLIDKGDSTISDPDGTRSDIGMYGGAYTKDFRYAPASFNLILPKDSEIVNPSGITLNWEKSFDRDKNDKIRYRIVIGRSKAEYSLNGKSKEYRIGMAPDTLYTRSDQLLVQSNFTDSTWYYWNVEAVDSSGLFKRANQIYSFFTSSAEPYLPVELGSFSYEVISNSVHLRWSTASEINNYGFEITRSLLPDSSSASKISFIKGKGTTTEKSIYEFFDKNLLPGSYQYQLIQIDLDGTRKRIAEKDISIINTDKYILYQNYPNPFNPVTKIEYNIPKESDITFLVYNTLGETVYKINQSNMREGSHKIIFDGRDLSSGVYFYRIQAGSFTATKKFILMK